MATNTFRLQYLAKAAAGVPRDLVNTFVSAKLKPIRPTVLIYNCTWVCDARCTMCNNWKRGDRKSDMTLAQLEPVMDNPFWGAVENLNISGGEPTTRNDLPEMVEMFQRHLPRLRKIGINTTGLTPHRAIPMLTRIVEFCAEKDLLISIRVSLDGIGDIHDQVRARQERLRQGVPDDRGDAGAVEEARQLLSSASPSTIFATNLDDAENILAWARTKKLDVVFNMLRFTDAMLDNKELEEKIGFHAARRRVHAQVLPRSRPGRIGPERPGVHVPALRRHDRQRLQADDALPVPEAGAAAQPERRPVLLRELGEARQRARRRRPRRCTSRPRTSRTGEHLKDKVCPTCLSPCQVNVGAMKQFVPYAKFLKRAYQVKRDPDAARRDAAGAGGQWTVTGRASD